MIENELDNGPQEPPVESAKKNNTRTLVKRTLAIAGLALVVYFLYSIVHLFVSPDRNIQQIYLVPDDAASSPRRPSTIGQSSAEAQPGNA